MSRRPSRNRPNRRSALLLLALLLAAAAPAAPARAIEEPHHFSLAYDVSLTGIPLMALEVNAVVSRDRYALRIYFFTYGVLDFMFRVRNESAVDGVIADDTVRPTRYTTVGSWRGSRRSADLIYRGPEVAVELDPPTIEDDREPVPEAMRGDTLDPLSPVVTLSLGLRAESPCPAKVPVFDGRRRYNMRLDPVGVEQLPAGNGSIAVGMTVKCLLVVEPIAGYLRSRPFRPRLPSEVWFQRLSDETLWVPIRVKGESFFGSFTAELKRYEPHHQL